MYVRIVTGQARPGQVDEAAKRWKEFFGPRAKTAPGLRHSYFGGDRATNRLVGISIWESRPDQAMMDQTTAEFRERLGDIAAGPPTIDEYEVLAEL